MPDQRFLLIALKAVAPEHEFFQKGYAYYRPANPNSIKNLKLMDNSDGLYDGLPMLPAHIYKPGKNIRLTQSQRDAIKLQVLEERQVRSTNRLQRHKYEMAQRLQE